jgi:hypothetical protein
MKEQNLSVMKIVRVGLYLARRLQEERLTARNQAQFQKMRSMLCQARSLIILKPGSYSMCLAMLPQIDAVLKEKPSHIEDSSQLALAA